MDLGYRRELDGLRGIAILAVLVYHTALFWFRGINLEAGALGVDLFFVLSGFLITSLLVAERRRSERISRRNFYVRRVLRLAPALGIGLGLGALALSVGGNPDEPSWLMHNTLPYGRAALMSLGFVGNWFGNKLGILGPTWSLGVEEQYYFVWPCILALLLWRSVRAQWIAIGVFGAAFGIFVVRYTFPHEPPTGVWTLLQPYLRADGILLGSALALVLSSKRWASRARRLLADRRLVVAIVVAGAAVLNLSMRGFQPVGPWMVLVCDLMFVVGVGHVVCDRSSPLSRAVASDPLVAIGRVSYGLYLYHVPIFYLAFMSATGWTSVGVAWAVSLAVSVGSFLCIESPVLSLKSRFVTKPALRSAPVMRTEPRFAAPRRRHTKTVPAAA